MSDVASASSKIAVDRDRVVQRVHERPAVAQKAEQPAPEALIVVDQVELGAAVAQQLVDAATERIGLGESGAGHDAEFLDVLDGPELVRPRNTKGVLAPV